MVHHEDSGHVGREPSFPIEEYGLSLCICGAREVGKVESQLDVLQMDVQNRI